MEISQIKNNKKIINAWAMYDWANSVYSLVITSTIFPIFFNESTRSAFGGDIIDFIGFKVSNTVVYSYAISLSFLLVAFISPALSGIADYSGKKKSFMKFFAYLGGFACIGLFFFEGRNVEYGIICSMLASIGYAGSLVFYNAYLPEIATPDRFDKISAKGFSLGYAGSIILMIFNLMMIQKPGWFGLEAGALPARISFLTVGLWWIGFSQISFYYLPSNIYNRKPSGNKILKGFRELKLVWENLGCQPSLKTFLFAFFFYNMGVQTVMYLAASFGEKELQLESGQLIIAILLIQIVAILGAYTFATLSKHKGNIFALTTMIIIWIGICIGAYFVYGPTLFYVLATVVGLVMGGIQSLSRSTYSKLLPETKDHASYFSFYDVVEKLSIVIGTASFGIIENFSGSMRNSVLPLAVFFIIGLLILQKLNSLKIIKEES